MPFEFLHKVLTRLEDAQANFQQLGQKAPFDNTGTLEADSVTATQIAAGAVGTSEVADGTLTDTDLASPNNSAYKTIYRAGTYIGLDATAATYIMGGGTSNVASGADIFGAARYPTLLPFDDADYVVASKTAKLQIRVVVACNATAPAITFTVGLYPVTTGGGADALTMTLGTVVTGSTIAIASPSGATPTRAVTAADFTVPADGTYSLGVVTSGTIANDSVVFVGGVLQTRNV